METGFATVESGLLHMGLVVFAKIPFTGRSGDGDGSVVSAHSLYIVFGYNLNVYSNFLGLLVLM